MAADLSNTVTKYRMVALDLDGTLLGPDHRLSDESVEYLRYLHSKGFIISIATGRVATCVFEHVNRLNLPFPANNLFSGLPMVCSNGAHGLKALALKGDDADDKRDYKSEDFEIIESESEAAVRFYGEEWKVSISDIFHEAVREDVVLDSIRIASELELLVQYYIGKDIYENATTVSHLKWVKKYSDLTGCQQIHCEDDFQEAIAKGPPSKILIFTSPLEIDNVHKKLMSCMGQNANVVRGSPPFFVEILSKDVCKGNGLKRLSESLGVSLEEVIAFGDGDNDLEFLQMAGRGIAMLNARENVKDIADEVCEWTNGEDGVIRKLKQMESEGKLQFS